MIRIPIGGIKTSGRLLALTVRGGTDGALSFSRICRLLAAESINIVFAAMGAAGDSSSGLCCIAHEDRQRVQTLLMQAVEWQKVLHLQSSLGLVGLYPHQHRFKVLGVTLDRFAKRQIKIYSLASSVSALSFIIDYHQMPCAIAVLSRCFKFPAGYDLPYPDPGD